MTDLNREIIGAHYAHYTADRPFGLLKPNESPNGNWMYHLFTNGNITYEKGGWAYGSRNVYDLEPALPGYKMLDFRFVKTDPDNKTYVILTEEECLFYRERMKQEIADRKRRLEERAREVAEMAEEKSAICETDLL